jgi:hypothetical protein
MLAAELVEETSSIGDFDRLFAKANSKFVVEKETERFGDFHTE